MIGDAVSLNVYLAPGVTDMGKSIDGLSLMVSEILELDPFSENLFVFCNRERNKLKILHWQTNGFWLYYRRLEITVASKGDGFAQLLTNVSVDT